MAAKCAKGASRRKNFGRLGHAAEICLQKNKLTAQQIHVLESIAGWRWDAAPEIKGIKKCGRGSGWMAQIMVAQHTIGGPQRSSAAQAKADYIRLKEAAPGGVDEV